MSEVSWQEFAITDKLRNGLITKLKRKEEIFSFSSDPLLASLITCLGIQAEIGLPELDRLSGSLGVNLSEYSFNP